MGIGITHGTVNRLKNFNQSPSEQILSAIARSENASMNWLTEGHGTPYRVTRVLDDEEGLEQLQALLAENTWQATLIDGQDCIGYALLLTQPDQYTLKGRTVDYTRVEILAGRLGPLTLAEVLSGFPDLRRLALAADPFQRLTQGQMGNYELLGWRDAVGL